MRAIARLLGVARNSVRKYLRADEMPKARPRPPRGVDSLRKRTQVSLGKGTQAGLVAGMVSVGGAAVKAAAAELVLEAVAGAVDGEDLALVEQAVEDGRGDHVVAEECAPAIEADVAGD